MAAEAHALAHTVYWTSSRGYFSATGRPVEKNSTGRPVERFYWTSSRTDDLGHYAIFPYYQNRDGVKSVFGETMLDKDPLYNGTYIGI